MQTKITNVATTNWLSRWA